MRVVRVLVSKMLELFPFDHKAGKKMASFSVFSVVVVEERSRF